jgi:riboflavin synthase alpha subunit
MNENIKYIELKSGFSDNGPAWIGKIKYSKSKRVIYFYNKGFIKVNGISGNYIDMETNEEYWISGIKKNEKNRHWAGNGKIIIDKNIVNEYLEYIEKDILNNNYIIEEIPEIYPIERINEIENTKINYE